MLVLEAAVAQVTLPVEENGVDERVSGQSATVSRFRIRSYRDKSPNLMRQILAGCQFCTEVAVIVSVAAWPVQNNASCIDSVGRVWQDRSCLHHPDHKILTASGRCLICAISHIFDFVLP